MAEPNARGDARRRRLGRTRWVAGGVAVGSTIALTGAIAAVNAAPGESSVGVEVAPDSEEYTTGRPFTPEESLADDDVDLGAASPIVPAPQTRSGGS
jgi:hypothetical protein